ncbi:MAG: cell envelope biogenesis protein OmpA, partial [Janthinobacterium sp.]
VLASGQGPDRPVASNATADGRARNRRIEFRIAQ